MGIMTQIAMPRRFVWTHAIVAERLREAMATLKAMPATGCFPAGAQSSMPDPVQRLADWMPQPGSPTFQQDYAHVLQRVADERHRNRGAPTAAAIERMEEALGWQWLVGHRRHWQCLAAWASNGRTSEVARRFDVTRMTVHRWRKGALDEIVWGLNGVQI